MNKLTLGALLLGATLFMGLGATSLSAMGDDAGKCGKAMQMPGGKCGLDKNASCKNPKDCDTMKPKCDNPKDCNMTKKCGGDKKAPPAAMKCGTGKCGGNK
jgi:hypothetical protein